MTTQGKQSPDFFYKEQQSEYTKSIRLLALFKGLVPGQTHTFFIIPQDKKCY